MGTASIQRGKLVSTWQLPFLTAAHFCADLPLLFSVSEVPLVCQGHDALVTRAGDDHLHGQTADA